jgi:hypothetical protein
VVVLAALVLLVVLACAIPPAAGPRSEIVTGDDGFRSFTWFKEVQGTPVACPAFGLVDPVRGTLAAAEADAREPILIRTADGRDLSVVWPAGFFVRFEPLAALYNDLGVVVVRERQEVVLGQTRWDEAAGTYEDPYLAQGIIYGGCYPYSRGRIDPP